MFALLFCALAVSPREQYEALRRQYDPLPFAFTSDPQTAKAACEPFLKLARENPDDPVAVDAMSWLIARAAFIGSVDEAMDLVGRDHATSDRLLPVIHSIDRSIATTASSLGLLRAVVQKNSHVDTRAWACLVLGRSIAKRKNLIQCRHGRLELTLHAHPSLKTRPRSQPEGESAEAIAAMDKEAGNLFERVIKEFAGFEDLADTARKELFELRHLAIGCAAPEIEGQDVDGNRFKLSDYRGKVVLLDFWSLGCGVCVRELPRLRQLVKRCENQP